MSFQQHLDEDVEHAIIQLCDALCQWERGTGRESVLIVREPGFAFRALSGKPIPDSCDDLDDTHFLKNIDAQEQGE